MLYNSDGLPVIFKVYQKVLNVIVSTFNQHLPYLNNNKLNRKDMQYENNLRKKSVL